MEISALCLPEKKLNQLRSKGIDSVESLLWRFPNKYMDFTRITRLVRSNENVQLQGAFCCTVQRLEQSPRNAKIPYVLMKAQDSETGVNVSVFWFRQYLKYGTFHDVNAGDKYLICGTAQYSTEYNSYTISSPSVFSPFSPDKLRLYPFYRKIPQMADDYYRSAVAKALAFKAVCKEPYPTQISAGHGYPTLDSAIRTLHNPGSCEELKAAQERIVFDILFKFSLQLQNAQSRLSKGSQYNLRSMKMIRDIEAALPYSLTEGQRNVLSSMFASMRDGRRIHALVQGDVGSGKTVVAMLFMAALVDSGFQCALMAPSRVLAQQHYQDIRKTFEPYGVKVALCLGASGLKKADLKAIANGEIQIVVGSHAILSPKVQFKELAGIVVDEEHKFGVAQRNALVEKASAGVHSVTMSATPIPRSLAQVVYGDDVQLCTIKSMPKGRVPVKTACTHRVDKALEAVERQLRLGHQAFAVCPAIAPNEKTERASVTELAEQYKAYLEPRGFKVATLTGKDSKAAMEETIRAFAAGETHVLLSTTVIEVGVNIPNATLIVIHDADCFGLSSLHQLRGRVGRSSFPSYCALVSDQKDNERLKTMVETNSGFEIAKKDLEMRGAGDWLGADQTGNTEPVQFMLAYPEIYQMAREDASAALRAGVNWPIVQDAFKDADDNYTF
jgi:ATP-dependent DNA helicase RecG